MTQLSAPLRFLITRLSHIGDCVLTIPLVQRLKACWPDCEIIWAMESPAHKLLGHLPEIDHLVLVPRGYLKKPGQVWRLRKQLRALRPDVVLDPQSLTKSSMLGWLSGAKVRLGLGGSYQKELSGWLNTASVEVPPSVTHLVDRTLLLLPAIAQHSRLAAQSLSPSGRALLAPGASAAIVANTYPHPPLTRPAIRLYLPVPQQDQQWVETQWPDGPPPVVINPGASWGSKRWENDRFAAVAQQLYRRGSVPSVVTWAGEEEHQWAQQIAQQSDGAAVVAPATTLTQLCALCRKASLFLGCDTGPMHMAAAVGTPCVVLFGPTRPQDSGPYGQQHYALQAMYQSGGARQRRQADNQAMQQISVAQVVAACESVLQHDGRLSLSDEPRRAG